MKQQPLSDIAIYEDALRGTWGCVKLLWANRGAKIAVTFGTLIPLAVIALDPFSQAVINIYSCQIPDSARLGSVTRPNSLQLPSAFPLNMQRQMTSAILGSEAFNITPSCSSGNCVFDRPYNSVGFCSSCTNITDRLERNCSLPVNTKPTYVIAPLPPCRWYLPHPSTPMGDEYGGFQFVGFDNITEGVGDNWNMLALDSAEGETRNFTVAWIGHELMLPQAASRSFQPCIRTYESTVINGTFNERIVASINWASNVPSYTNAAALYAHMLDRDCLPDSAKKALAKQNFDMSSQWIIYGFKYINPLNSALLNSTKTDPTIPNECIYQYQMINDELVNATDSISNWFDGAFGQTLAATAFYNDTTVTSEIASGSAISQRPTTPILIYTESQASQSSIMQALYANASITMDTVGEMLNNLAITTTNFARSSPTLLANGPPPPNIDNAAVLVPILLQESCIRINWPWLALPTILIVLSILILYLTVLQTMKPTSVGVWKSSALALLWHGFDVPQEAPEAADMEDVSRNMHTKLEETHLGWKLVQYG
ncbi:hypothetical protein TARUN_1706 [Trichoderma arundinaceum]|uniref:Uncharacterized protein n=1 Tax=Trichoderma arundinaceum TaxID=490622 RepID=A0A395NWQ9_TRIAR|nr:hypothetical protein TARUN_1706 [Trichoderma arundinaceum]